MIILSEPIGEALVREIGSELCSLARRQM